MFDEDIIKRWGHLPYWGVVSTWAADSFYENLTYTEAVALAEEEIKEPGRDATIVLLISKHSGPPICDPAHRRGSRTGPVQGSEPQPTSEEGNG